MLKGKTALITGGGTGIGRGMALALARRGVLLVLVGRRLDPLVAVCQEAEGLGTRAIPIVCDVANVEERANLWSNLTASLNRAPDILIHNAATLARSTLSAVTEEEVRVAIETNLTAPLEITRHAIPGLAERQGAVVLIGSAMPYVPMPGCALYAATKAGVRAAAESLRYELSAQGIHLLYACPPVTETAMTDAVAKELATRRLSYPRANAERVGEQIVDALSRGRDEIDLRSPGERLLEMAFAVAPGLVRRVLRKLRA